MKFSFVFTLSLLLQLLFTVSLSAQTWEWAISSGYTTPLLINNSYTSSEGITIAAGSYMDSIKIGHVALVNPGSGKFFIAVINADGSVSHAFSDGQSFPELEPVGYGQVNTVFLDKDKNIFIAGLGTHEIKFGNQTYTAAANTQSFIAKYTYYGTLLWVKTFSSQGYYNDERMNEFKIDDNGNIYCTGIFREGDLNISGTVLHSSSIENAYLIKYNSDAELQWAQTFSSENNLSSYGSHLAVSNEKIYWMGNFSGDLTLQSQSLASENGGGGFLACLDHDGTLSWINNSQGYAEASLACGDSMLLVGCYNTKDTTLLGEHLDYSALYLIAYDINGNSKWVKQIVKPDLNSSVVSYSDFYSLFIDMGNNVGVGGRFAGDVTLGETAVSSAGSSDIFLLKSNPIDGRVSEFITLGSNKTEYPTSIAMDQCGNNYFTGLYVDSTHIGDIKLVNESTSLFVAKYKNNPDCLLPTAINTPNVTNTITLYPNPAHQAVNIVFPTQPKEELTVIVYNEMGKTESLQYHEINGTTLELPLHLLPGLYIMKVISAEQTYTSKLVIE